MFLDGNNDDDDVDDNDDGNESTSQLNISRKTIKLLKTPFFHSSTVLQYINRILIAFYQ